MEEKTTKGLKEQRERRKRINRIYLRLDADIDYFVRGIVVPGNFFTEPDRQAGIKRYCFRTGTAGREPVERRNVYWNGITDRHRISGSECRQFDCPVIGGRG